MTSQKSKKYFLKGDDYSIFGLDWFSLLQNHYYL